MVVGGAVVVLAGGIVEVVLEVLVVEGCGSVVVEVVPLWEPSSVVVVVDVVAVRVELVGGAVVVGLLNVVVVATMVDVVVTVLDVVVVDAAVVVVGTAHFARKMRCLQAAERTCALMAVRAMWAAHLT